MHRYASSSYVPDIMSFASVCHTNINRLHHTYTKLYTSCNLLSDYRPPRRVDCLVTLWSIGVKCLFQGHNITLPSSRTEPRVKNLAVTNLSFYSHRCTAANWNDGVKYFFSRTPQRIMPSVGNHLETLRSPFGALQTELRQRHDSYTCLSEPIQNKPLWLNKLVRLNKTVLYNEEFVNAGIVDYGHLINSAGELWDYDGVTKKFDIPSNNSSFIEFTKLYAALPFCWEDNKNYQIPDNHDHLSSFRLALNNITFSTKWVYICLREFNIVEPIKQQ